MAKLIIVLSIFLSACLTPHTPTPTQTIETPTATVERENTPTPMSTIPPTAESSPTPFSCEPYDTVEGWKVSALRGSMPLYTWNFEPTEFEVTQAPVKCFYYEEVGQQWVYVETDYAEGWVAFVDEGNLMGVLTDAPR